MHIISYLQRIIINFVSHLLAAILLRMISHVLTEDVFREGLLKYLQAQLV